MELLERVKEEDRFNQIRTLLINKGYDGIEYENEHGGDGTSFIAFSSEQIKIRSGSIQESI